MRVIQHNPYRYLGIQANASAAQKLAAKNKLAAYLKIGKQVNSDFDFSPPLPEIVRNIELIDAKSNEVLTAENNLISTLFWFQSEGNENEQGFEAIKSKSYDEALTVFQSLLTDGQVTEQNLSAAINYSTLDIILFAKHRDENRLKFSLNIKLSIIISENLRNVILQRTSINASQLSLQKMKEITISEIKEIIQALMPDRNIDEIFNDYFFEQNEILNDYNDEKAKRIVKQIKEIIIESEQKRKEIKKIYKESDSKNFGELTSNLASNGNNTFKLVTPHLSHLKNLLGNSHPQTCATYTSFLNEINYTGLDCFNIMIDALSSSSDSEKRALVLSIDTDALNSIIEICNASLEESNDVNIPIAATLRENTESYVKWLKMILDSKSKNSSGGSEWISDGCLKTIIQIIIYSVIGFLISKC